MRTNFKLFKDKSCVIARHPVWVIFHGPYLYVEESLFGVLWSFLTEFKHDKHLVGF